MSLSARATDHTMVGRPVERSISQTAKRRFLLWTLFWWSGAGVCALLFYIGLLDFVLSTKIALYGISIWLNGWLLGLVARKHENLSRMSIYHDCLVMWMLSYAVTNILWEIPWVIFSPVVFHDLHTIDDVVAYTAYMRESVLHMYWWTLASFSSVDLRTVNHDPTFYTIEIYAVVNVLTTIYFFHLNKKRSPYRYLVAVIGCGEPVAATFIFSFAEVFASFENMVGGGSRYLACFGLDPVPIYTFPVNIWLCGVSIITE